MPMSTLVPHYTAEEVRGFPDDRLRYEVIRGELFVTPTPGTAHQRAVLELARRLQGYLETHAIGEALPAPLRSGVHRRQRRPARCHRDAPTSAGATHGQAPPRAASPGDRDRLVLEQAD